MSRKRRKSFDWLAPIKCEGMRFVVTDFGTVNVKMKTAEWFVKHHESPRLQQVTVIRRANDSIVATACFLAEQAWRDGKSLEQI